MLRSSVRRVNALAKLFGFNLEQTLQTMLALPTFYRDLRHYRSATQEQQDFPQGKLYPCLFDRQADSGGASGHYFHQDLLVAQRIFENNPTHHVDIGSRVDGFIAHVASFREIESIDIRKQPHQVQNIQFIQADLMAPHSLPEGYCDSLSCLHTIEHFGLGRYGDPIDADGHLKGLKNMHRIVQQGGKFYFSTVVGPQRVEFNAHRVFGLRYLLKHLEPLFEVDYISYVDDAGALHKHISLTEQDIEQSFGVNFGCVIFELHKR